MQTRLHILITVIIAIVYGPEVMGLDKGGSPLKALAARQALEDKVAVALADGHINVAERERILNDARRVLTPEEYTAFVQRLDRLAPTEIEQPQNLVQRFKSNRATLMTVYWPQSMFAGLKRPFENFPQMPTLFARRHGVPSSQKATLVAVEERVLPEAGESEKGSMLADDQQKSLEQLPELTPIRKEGQNDTPVAPMPETVHRKVEKIPVKEEGLKTARTENEKILPVEPEHGAIMVVTGISE